MGKKYADAQLLSLADPRKTDSPLKAIGDGMINVAKYHKQWMLDKIQDKLANNELDLSYINLDIAKATKDDKIAMSNLGREKAEVDLDTAKIDKDAKEFDLGLKKKYDESVILQNLANQKAQENYTKANTSKTWLEVEKNRYDFNNIKNLDNTIRYTHSLGFVPTGDPEKDFTNIQGLLLQQMENENDPQKRKELGNYLNTLNQQKDKIFDMWNLGLKQNVDGANLGDIKAYQNTISDIKNRFGAKTISELEYRYKELEELLEKVKANPNAFKYPDAIEKEIVKDKEEMEKAFKAYEYLQNFSLKGGKSSSNQTEIDKDLQKNLERLGKFDSLDDTIGKMIGLVENEADFFNTGVWSNINLADAFRRAGLTDKSTPREKMQIMKEQILAQYSDFLASSKLKAAFEASLSVMVDDIDKFGQNKSKIINQLNKLRQTVLAEKGVVLDSIPLRHLDEYINIANRRKQYPHAYSNKNNQSKNQGRDKYDTDMYVNQNHMMD